jgi:hypothetical protein
MYSGTSHRKRLKQRNESVVTSGRGLLESREPMQVRYAVPVIHLGIHLVLATSRFGSVRM